MIRFQIYINIKEDELDSEILQMFKNYSLVFDIVRIIDPTKKKVVLCNDNSNVGKFDGACFELLKKNKACVNCTTSRAYCQKKNSMKMECFESKIYWIISTPVNVHGERYIFELIKDITNEKIINTDIVEMKKEIDRINILTVTDELTGAYNRRYINEHLPVDIINNNLYNKILTIAVMDIDFFKNINDTYGHVAGDYILKEIVKIIKSNIRTTDWVARYGGEEFVIVFNHNKCENIVKVIERIRKKIEEYNFFFEGMDISVKASFGVASFTKGENVETLLEAADKKLYEAKRTGRNKIVY